MVPIDSDTDSLAEYFARLSSRLDNPSSVEQRLVHARRIACAPERHLERLKPLRRRLHRAEQLGDAGAIEYERDSALAILYEVVDAVVGALTLLELDGLDLTSSSDHCGLAGEDAPVVVELLKNLNRYCRAALDAADEFGIKLDFSKSVDEREGITYERHRHWQDFVPGSIDESFTRYFSALQLSIRQTLARRPAFWEHQTFGGYIRSHRYEALYEVLHRLDEHHFGAARPQQSWLEIFDGAAGSR